MNLDDLTDRALRYEQQMHEGAAPLPGLTVYRRRAVAGLEAMVYEPVLCLILQGAKVTATPEQRVDLARGDALLVSHDLPVLSRITEASEDAPYIALLLSLDLALVRELYPQVAGARTSDAPAHPLAAGPADPAWMEPLARYLDLAAAPMDARVLGASVLREVHYRLLLSPLGAMLRGLMVADSQASRIATAIQHLRTAYRAPLGVADLARSAGMSTSSFHQYFKQVTGTTPLQYQKDLRLIEARTLLSEKWHSVTEAAHLVGYESPTQFSREYSRKFGHPPSRSDQ